MTGIKFEKFISHFTLYPNNSESEKNFKVFEEAIAFHRQAIISQYFEQKIPFYQIALERYLTALGSVKLGNGHLRANILMQTSRVLVAQAIFLPNITATMRRNLLSEAYDACKQSVEGLKQLAITRLNFELGEHFLSVVLHRAKYAATDTEKINYLDTAFQTYLSYAKQKKLLKDAVEVDVCWQLRYCEYLSFRGCLQKTPQLQAGYFETVLDVAASGPKMIKNSGVELPSDCRLNLTRFNRKMVIIHALTSMQCLRAQAHYNLASIALDKTDKSQHMRVMFQTLNAAKARAAITNNPDFLNVTILDELHQRLKGQTQPQKTSPAVVVIIDPEEEIDQGQDMESSETDEMEITPFMEPNGNPSVNGAITTIFETSIEEVDNMLHQQVPSEIRSAMEDFEPLQKLNDEDQVGAMEEELSAPVDCLEIPENLQGFYINTESQLALDLVECLPLCFGNEIVDEEKRKKTNHTVQEERARSI